MCWIQWPYIYIAGFLMTYNTGGNTVSTAQLALSLLCTTARRISEGNMSMKVKRRSFQPHIFSSFKNSSDLHNNVVVDFFKEGKWERKKFVGMEVVNGCLLLSKIQHCDDQPTGLICFLFTRLNCIQLTGKTIGIVGCGRIGRQV